MRSRVPGLVDGKSDPRPRLFGFAWDLTASESGTATAWADLPTPMVGTIKTTGTSILEVHAMISRVQHDTGDVSTDFRITVDGVMIAVTGMGNALSWAFRAVSFHGYTTVTAGTHTVRVEYRTQTGTVTYWHNGNGEQFRRLTVKEFAPS